MRRALQLKVKSDSLLNSLLVLAASLAFMICYFSGAHAAPEKYCLDTEIRRLPGVLNKIPCFNSNAPEMVLSEGILLSTFPPEGMKHPEAHLNYAFNGNFDIFSHHIAKNEVSEEDRCLYLAFIMGNPSNKKVKVQVLSGASYLSQPDSPFISLPEVCLNNDGKIFAGPGDRVTNDILRGSKITLPIPKSIMLNAGETKFVMCLPVPVRHLRPALNGRSTLLKLKSNGPVYVASLAKFSRKGDEGTAPAVADWLDGLQNFDLVKPRDDIPTPPGAKGRIKYGRVSGVAIGTEWTANITDEEPAGPLNLSKPAGTLKNASKHANSSKNKAQSAAGSNAAKSAGSNEAKSDSASTVQKKADASNSLKQDPSLNELEPTDALAAKQPGSLIVPRPGKCISYPISTVDGGTFGTGQVQSAPMAVRYKDTAYEAHGNYGIRYRFTLPLYNPYKRAMNIQVVFQSAIKSADGDSRLCYYESAPPRAFFRGTVHCIDGNDSSYWHLVQKQGDEGAKLAEFTMPPSARHKLYLEFLYPPDATPPQEICIRSLTHERDAE